MRLTIALCRLMKMKGCHNGTINGRHHLRSTSKRLLLGIHNQTRGYKMNIKLKGFEDTLYQDSGSPFDQWLAQCPVEYKELYTDLGGTRAEYIFTIEDEQD